MSSVPPRQPRSRPAVVGFWVAVVTLGVVGVVTFRTMSAVLDATALVEHTHEVVEHLLEQRAALAEAVAARRAHALTGDQAMLTAFDDAIRRVHAEAVELKALTVDSAAQQERMNTLESLVQGRVARLTQTIEDTRIRAYERDREVERTRGGSGADAQIFAAVSDTVREELRLLELQRQKTLERIESMRLVRVVGALFSLAALFFAFRYLRRELGQRFELEQRARESEDRLATTLMSIGDGVISTDNEGCIVRMNRVAEELTGWGGTTAIGKPATDVFRVLDQKTRAPLVHPIERALADAERSIPVEPTLLLAKDGRELPIADSCAPVRDAKGRILGAVLVFRDRSEEERVKMLQETAQRQIMLSERMASVGTLAAGVAHEINNPLSYVIANLELILEEIRALSGGSTASPRMKELEDMTLEARQGAERVRKIVRGMKTFSRAEEERPEVIDVKSVLEISINMAFNEIRHRARLVKDFGEIPLVQADEARLGQVFINLLVNAAQAIPEGDTASNEIRIVTSTDSEGRAVIEVRDTGPGISAAVLGRVFDPFFTTKPVGIGTGLGLSICHNIVTKMGGQIEATSELGRGTTFRVRLPASHGRLAIPSVLPSLRPAAPAPLSILIVDDEPAVGVSLGRVLRDHDVTVVTKATDALDLLGRGSTFDIIFSDLMMAEMSGMDLYEELTRRHPAAAQRVVFITGGAFTPAANAFLDRVPNERMEKPFVVKTVRDLVQKFAT